MRCRMFMLRRLFIVFLFVFCLVGFLSVFPVVAEMDFGEFYLTHWDDVASGLDSGTSIGVEFENIGDANRFETSTSGDLSAPNSLKVHPDDTDSCLGWINITDDYVDILDVDYVYSVNFSVYLFEGTGNQIVEFSFYNGSTMVVNLTLGVGNGAANEVFWWYDVSSGTQTVYSSNTGTTRWYVIFTHNGTNQFHVELLSSTFVELAAGDYGGASSTDWYMFDSLYVHQTSNQPGATGCLYIDNLILDLEPDVALECYNLDFSNMYHYDGAPLHNVSQGDNVHYTLGVSGDMYAVPYFWIYNPNDVLVYSRVFDPIDSYLFAYHSWYMTIPSNWIDGNYTFRVTDFNVLNSNGCGLSYNVSQDVFIGDLSVSIYNGTFWNDGDPWAEFQYLEYPDDAYVGDPIRIVYWLPENSSATNLMDDYCYVIAVHNTYYGPSQPLNWMTVVRGGLGEVILDDGNLGLFDSVGRFQLFVWNLSDTNYRSFIEWDVVVTGDLEYISNTLWCWRDREHRNETQVTPEDSDSDTEFWEMIAGFGIIFGFGITPIFLFRDNSFAIQNGIYIMLLFALIGTIIVGYYELVDLVYIYLIALVCVAGIGLKLYSFAKG